MRRLVTRTTVRTSCRKKSTNFPIPAIPCSCIWWSSRASSTSSAPKRTNTYRQACTHSTHDNSRSNRFVRDHRQLLLFGTFPKTKKKNTSFKTSSALQRYVCMLKHLLLLAQTKPRQHTAMVSFLFLPPTKIKRIYKFNQHFYLTKLNVGQIPYLIICFIFQSYICVRIADVVLVVWVGKKGTRAGVSRLRQSRRNDLITG